MQSFIIIGKDKEKVRKQALKITQEEKISKFDVYTLEPEKTVGIADIRLISTKIYLKPIQGDKKAIILEAFLGMTQDSQNAFLKMLEEPPLSTTIIVLANSNFFLPTVLSRCKLITLDKGMVLEKEEQDNLIKIISNFPQMKIGDKLKLAQDLSKDKETALNFLEKLIITQRDFMIKNEGRGEYKKIIEIMQKYYKEIKNSNVNLRLGLENLFLEL